MSDLPECINGLPNICGSEQTLADAVRVGLDQPGQTNGSPIDFNRIKSACAIALHMHQPLIPAGSSELSTAKIIGNLEDMMNHQEIGDNHNAPVFLEYSGTLLHGLRRMGLHDVFDNLRRVTSEPRYRGAVEWLGCAWGHP